MGFDFGLDVEAGAEGAAREGVAAGGGGAGAAVELETGGLGGRFVAAPEGKEGSPPGGTGKEEPVVAVPGIKPALSGLTYGCGRFEVAGVTAVAAAGAFGGGGSGLVNAPCPCPCPVPAAVAVVAVTV